MPQVSGTVPLTHHSDDTAHYCIASKSKIHLWRSHEIYSWYIALGNVFTVFLG